MFGYVRPFRDELKVKDFEAYQALYCGLCHTIGDRYGWFARQFLNYDFTFLAMVLSSGEKPQITRQRCPVHPVGGCMACHTDPALAAAADGNVILAYWKLRDNADDNGFWKGLPARVLAFLLRPAYRKAADFRPGFDKQVRDCLAELRALETEKSASIDRTADTFARILKAAAPDTGDEHRDRPIGQLLYHIGRWIYLVDAWDDLEEDRAHNQYNPILFRFGDGTERARESLRTTLRHSLNLAASAYALTEFGCWTDIIGNIIYLGLPMVEELVFTGQWKQAKRLLPGGRNNNRRKRT